MAKPVVTINLKGDPSQLNRVLGNVQSELRGMGGAATRSGATATRAMNKMSTSGGAAIGGLAAKLAALTAGFLGVRKAVGIVKESISQAAEFSDFEASFTTLLGSADKAKERMAELAKFGETTPFQLDEVVKANRTLETLTGGALSTKEGMQMLGDTSAVAGVKINELSMWFGRLYDGIQSGRGVGEAMMRMQELGIVSGEVRGRIEEMQEAGATGSEVWDFMTASFGRFSGEMDRRSKKWNGLMSNLKDGIDALYRSFGEPIKNSLKPLLSDLVKSVGEFKKTAEDLGRVAGNGIRAFIQAFEEGSLSEIIGLTIMAGFEKAREGVNRLVEHFITMFAGDGAGGKIGGAILALSTAMAGIFASAISPVVNRLVAGAIVAGSQFAQAIKDNIPDWIVKTFGGNKSEKAAALKQRDSADERAIGALQGQDEVDKWVKNKGGFDSLSDAEKSRVEEMRKSNKREYDAAIADAEEASKIINGDISIGLDEAMGMAKEFSDGFQDNLTSNMDLALQSLLDLQEGLQEKFLDGENSSFSDALQEMIDELSKRNREATAETKREIEKRDLPDTEGGEGGKGTKSSGIKSVTDNLQQIGGGGVAFGGIAPLSDSDKQNAKMDEQTEHLRNQSEMQNRMVSLLAEGNRLVKGGQGPETEPLTVVGAN